MVEKGSAAEVGDAAVVVGVALPGDTNPPLKGVGEDPAMELARSSCNTALMSEKEEAHAPTRSGEMRVDRLGSDSEVPNMMSKL